RRSPRSRWPGVPPWRTLPNCAATSTSTPPSRSVRTRSTGTCDRSAPVSDFIAGLDEVENQNAPGPKLTVDAGPDGGEFTGLVTTEPVKPGEYQGAFAKVYELAGLNPDDYRIVDDTVRFSSWQQSSRPPGSVKRDIVTLYAYRARFQRITRADRDVENIAELVKIAKQNARRKPRQNPARLTRIVVASDAQIGGVGSRGGTQALLDRVAILLQKL